MLSFHHPISLDFFYRPKSDLMHLFLSGVARRVAVTLFHLFSPVYIYLNLVKIGFSGSQAISTVLVYYAFAFFVKLLTLVFSEDLSRKIGFKGTIRLSILPFILFIPLLIYASRLPILFILAAAFWGLHAGFFWWGYHGYFIKTGEKEHFGKSVGEANFLETAAIVLTPLGGAFIASLLGFSVLFIFSAVFMLMSLLLLGREHERRQERDVRFSDVVDLIRTHKSISLAYLGAAGETIIYLVVWPIFLFLFFGKVVSLGIIISAAALIAAVFAVVIGEWADKQGERKIVKLGAPLLFFSWMVRVFSKSFSTFVVADSFRNFGQRMVVLPLNALSYKKALEAESAKAVLFLETTMIAGVIIALLALSLWIYMGGDLAGSFVIAAVLSTLPLIAVVKHRIRDIDDKKG